MLDPVKPLKDAAAVPVRYNLALIARERQHSLQRILLIYTEFATRGDRVSDKDRKRLETGKRIKQLRIARELTLHELGKKAKMSAGYLSEVERGGPALSSEKLEALATALGSSVEYLLAGTSGPEEAGGVTIPAGLAEAAEMLDLSYAQTRRLLAGKRSLVAARGPDQDEWTADQWIRFHDKVKPYL